ncbi:MAG: SsrA-binding protein SmpB [Pseudomonadota bacterium]|nr:SsrA-binding protein SmpB [Pseudomonadota bacterium]
MIYSAPIPNSHTNVAKGKGNSTKAGSGSGTIAQNRRARHDYHLEQRFEAGIALLGWEVKAIREGRVALVDSYVALHKGEAFLTGANITPLLAASTHVIAEPQRMRKLLLHARELAQLFAATQQKGFTCIPTAMYWKGNKVKLEIALGKGKQLYDKRATKKDQDWQRDKARLMKSR